MRLQSRNYSKVTLNDILRKKRKTLKQFLNEMGIVTYELLKSRCQTMGIQPPDEQDFNNTLGNPLVPETSSPTEGVIVLAPLEEKIEYSASTPNTLTQQNTDSNLNTKKKKPKNSEYT